MTRFIWVILYDSYMWPIYRAIIGAIIGYNRGYNRAIIGVCIWETLFLKVHQKPILSDFRCICMWRQIHKYVWAEEREWLILLKKITCRRFCTIHSARDSRVTRRILSPLCSQTKRVRLQVTFTFAQSYGQKDSENRIK